MGKRIFLFLLTNVAIIATVSIIMNIFGIGGYITESGLDYKALLVFTFLWGMGGAFISLAISKWMAKKAMGVQIIDPNSFGNEAQLVQMVHRLAKNAGLRKMPEVGIYQSPEVNAFATGPSRSNSLVAVSSGLLNNMNSNEVEGVLGHEIAHIANGDMVTMTLIQGVVNAFTMFLARVLSYGIIMAMDDDEGEGFGYLSYYLLTIVFDIIFSILGSIVVAYFSRVREFQADKGGAKYAGRENMIDALVRLKQSVDLIDNKNKSLNTMKISNRSGFLSLFSTHPPLDVRIQRLKDSL